MATQSPGRPGAGGPAPVADDVAVVVPPPGGVLRRVRAFDAAAERWMSRVRSPRLDPVAYGLSSACDHSLLWHLAAAVRAARTGSPAVLVRMAVVLGAESALTNGVVKSFFRRLRPDRDPLAPLHRGLRRPVTSSFPSGHATAAFTAAVLLAHGRRAGGAWYVLAGAVALTRVYVGLHHASDVVAGGALGLAFGHAARRVLPIGPAR